MKKKSAGAERIAYLAAASKLTADADPALGRLYGLTMRHVARKTVTRLDREIKRQYCRECCIPLVPGLTGSYRLQDLSKKQNCPVLKVQCRQCLAVKRYPQR